jgi:hypothetical protein
MTPIAFPAVATHDLVLQTRSRDDTTADNHVRRLYRTLGHLGAVIAGQPVVGSKNSSS